MKKFLICALALVAVLAFAVSCKSPGSGQGSVEKTNVIIFVNFADSTPYGEDKAASSVDNFNTSQTGLKAFFLAESLGKCSVTSYYGGIVTLDNKESYYKRKGLLSNRDGYSATDAFGKPHVDAFFREQMLIREAVKKADIPADIVTDCDGDGIVDGITLVLNSDFSDWRSADQQILWPHKSEFYPYDEALLQGFYVPEGFFTPSSMEGLQVPEINGAKAGSYAVVCLKSTVGEVCHEFSHVLGLPDYYSYVDGIPSSYDNLGGYELMGADVGDIPQFSLAFVRSKLGWISDGEEIEVVAESKAVTLFPVTDGGVQAVKIIPPNFVEKGEFFMVEARRKQADTFDDAINATGVIIYSVKEESAYINADGGFSGRDYGNMYGDGDYEVSLFLNPSAPINYFTGKQGFNALENITFRDGTSSGVSVTGITANEDGSFSFNVTVEGQPPKAFLPEVKMLADNGVLSFAWECGNGGKTYVMAINATPKAAARYSLDDLPSAKSVVRGKGEGLDVLYVKSMPSAVRRYLPKVSGECYFVVVTENALGEIVDYNTFHVGVEGQPYVQAGFGDFIFASLRVGNPAFIAVCGVGGLCVLVGIVGVVLVRIRRKQVK